MLMHFDCPQCRRRLATAGHRAGQRVICPGCYGVTRVPMALAIPCEAAALAEDQESPPAVPSEVLELSWEPSYRLSQRRPFLRGVSWTRAVARFRPLASGLQRLVGTRAAAVLLVAGFAISLALLFLAGNQRDRAANWLTLNESLLPKAPLARLEPPYDPLPNPALSEEAAVDTSLDLVVPNAASLALALVTTEQVLRDSVEATVSSLAHLQAPQAMPAVAAAPKRATENYGTSVEFWGDPAEASRFAERERKLLFLLHLSGNFEEAKFT